MMYFQAGKLLAFLLVLIRIGGFWAASPLFRWDAIPVTIRLGMSIVAGVFFSSIIPCPFGGENISALQIGIIAAGELIYGIALGLVTDFIFSAVKLAAQICEREMGMTLAGVLDPFSEEEGQPLSMVVEIFFILLLLNVNGHHAFLVTIAKSYEAFPAGAIPQISKLTESIMAAGSTMLFLGLQIATPVLAVFMVILAVLAVLARIAPEANILFLSLPLRVGVGLLIVGVFLPLSNSFVSSFANWLDRLLPI